MSEYRKIHMPKCPYCKDEYKQTQFFSNDIMISICGSTIEKITEQMKGEQDE